MTYMVPPYPPLINAPPPGNDTPVSRMVAWTVIVVSVAIMAVLNWAQSHQAAQQNATTWNPPRIQVEIAGRYAVGANALLSQSSKSSATAQLFITELDQVSKTREDKLAVVVVVGELLGKQAALLRLDVTPPTTAPATHPANLSHDANPAPLADALKIVYADGPQALSAGQRAILVDQLGWYGKLAESFGKPSDDPERMAVLAAARRTAATIIVVLGAIFAGLALGMVLLIVFLVRLSDNKVRLDYHPVPGGDVFLEAFAIYIGGLTGAFLAAPYLPGLLRNSIGAHVALMVLPTILAIVWPAIRGTSPGAWRYGLGWHAGRGFFREIGMGLAGYVAGLPVVAAGFFVTFKLIKASGATPSHPIEHMIGGSANLTLLAFLLVSVYAPLTEETMFRGALFHALRGRHRWILSAAISSFIFAAIHPQGWTLVPTLMAIAIVFAGIREWRSTILSSAAAHCVHNTLTLAVLLLLMG